VVTTEWGTFPDELSPSEAMMWKGEDQARLRSGGILVLLLDRSPDWPRLTASFERYSSLFPRLRQRIATTPFGLSPPRWVVDPDFDLSFHLRHVALPPPGTFDQLLELIACDVSSGFDRLRPPWVGTVVDGLAGGQAALVLKQHHALFDGPGMVQILGRWLDRERESQVPAPVAAPPPQTLSDADLLRAALNPLRLAAGARRSFRRTGSAATAFLRPRELAARVAAVVGSMDQIAGPSVKNGSPLLAGRSTSARLGTLDVPLADLKAAAKSAGGTLNDVLLAAVADALGRYHQHFGKRVESVNLAFPVSVRTDDDEPGGNRFSGAMICAPADLADPASRIARIHAQVLSARDLGAAELVAAFTAVAYRLPSWLVAAVPLMDKVDAQVSNFPGLPYRHYLAGAEVLRSYGFESHPGTPMMIVLMSHAGTCCVSVNVDAAAVTEMPVLMKDLREAVNDVLALAGGATPARTPLSAEARPS
jgi:diacylglycerol O-acyltransferase / wax synthase